MRSKNGSKWIQGAFFPTNPAKYVGDVKNIFFRSSWERLCMSKFDIDPNVVNWNSEEIVVPYQDPTRGNSWHRYYPDFLVKTRDGVITMKEIKPSSQQEMPTRGRKSKKRFITEATTYMQNQAKWEAAKIFCKTRGWVFEVLNERDLGIRTKKSRS